jgi:hypothetical protein
MYLGGAKVSSYSRTKRGKLEKGVSEGSKMRGAALHYMKKLSAKWIFLTRVKGVPPLSGIAAKVIQSIFCSSFSRIDHF